MIAGENRTVTRESGPSSAAGPSILVVDDNEANRDVLSRLLQRKGYTVEAATDGGEALDRIRAGGFDLILLDVTMPGLNGLEVLQTLRRTHSATDLPVIMATAKDESEDIVRALDLGANDYVTKPLDLAVVLARIQTHLSLKRSVQQIRNLEEHLSRRNAELEAANARMRLDLRAAARIQEAFLPRPSPRYPGMNFAWKFQPCEELAGDSLNVCPLDADHVGVYVLDVSGHGVAAALLAVTVTRLLSPAGHRDSLLVHGHGGSPGQGPVPPAEVVARLNQRFPWDEATGQFFTIVYGVVHTKTGELVYASAGHPGGLHLGRDGSVTTLEGNGLPVGLGSSYAQYKVQLRPGDRLYFYSDGITEARNPQDQLYGSQRLQASLGRGRSAKLEDSIALLVDDLQGWCQAPFQDDVSVLALEATPGG